MYSVIYYDSLLGHYRSVSEHTDKYNALNDLEARALAYVQERDGLSKAERGLATFLFAKKEMEARRKTVPPGHYVFRDCTDQIHCLEIWQRYDAEIISHGYLYNSQQTKCRWRRAADFNLAYTRPAAKSVEIEGVVPISARALREVVALQATAEYCAVIAELESALGLRPSQIKKRREEKLKGQDPASCSTCV